MFKRIYYDNYSKKIHLWETYNGKVSKLEEKYEYKFYVNDASKKSKIKDINGYPVKLQICKDKRHIEEVKQSGLTVHQSDVNEEVSFLQERYKDVTLKANIKDFNIGYLDIECEAREFPYPDKALYPINLISVISSKTGQVYTFGIREYTGTSDVVQNYAYIPDEKAMLEKFVRWWRKQKFDVISGWYCLDENSNIWLQNKIIKIKNTNKNEKLHKYGKITNKIYTDKKKGYDLKLSNGTNLITSNNHLLPIYLKKKNKYVNENTILKEKIFQTKQIKELMNNNDCYLKIDRHKNNNNDLTFKTYILNNLDNLLEEKSFNFVFSKKYYNKYKLNCKYNSYTYTVRNPHKFSYKQLQLHYNINKQDIIDFFKEETDVYFVNNKKKIKINIETKINNDLMRIVGLIFTDGCISYKHVTFYNKDEKLINNIQQLLYNNKITKKIVNYDKKNIRIRFGYILNVLYLLRFLIYRNDKKHIDLESLSLLSYNQFKSFATGLIDGDGWVTYKNGIGFCSCIHYNLKNINELFAWNNVITSMYKNRLYVPLLKQNKEFFNNLELKNSYKSERIKTIECFEFKNSRSNKIKKYIYDDFLLIRIDEINVIAECNMYDISTSTGFFNTNYGIKSHNCKDFDLQYIINRLERLGSKAQLSPINKFYQGTRTGQFGKKVYNLRVGGLNILDYRELYMKFTFNTLDSYSLNSVAHYEKIGGKLELEGHINDAWEKNWNLFVEYNIQDVRLCEKLEECKGFIALAIQFASDALIPIDRVFSSIATVEGYIQRKLNKNNIVVPDRKHKPRDLWLENKLYVTEKGLQNVDIASKQTTFEPYYVKGAHVQAFSGLYNTVLEFDVKSLYPHNVMMFNISPEVKLFNPSEERIAKGDLIKTPMNGIYYLKNKKGIIPSTIEDIFNERVKFEAKRNECLENKDETTAKFYDSMQHNRKILINSFYGCIANPYSRFYDVDNARVITRAGRVLIKHLSKTTNKYFKEYWHKVAKKHYPDLAEYPKIEKPLICLIDTDSNYVCLHEIKKKYSPESTLLEFTSKMEKEVLNPFYSRVLDIYAKQYNAPQLISFDRGKIIEKQFILAKKKYISRIVGKDGIIYDKPKLKATGGEIVKSDVPKWCREQTKRIVEAIFEGEEPSREHVMNTLKDIKREFKSQKMEDISFNISVNEYTKYANPTETYVKNKSLYFKSGTPMHVRASMIYNFVVVKFNLPYMQIGNSTKIKYIHIDNKNILGADVVGYIGNWPEQFDKYFKLDVNTQFNKGFLQGIQRMFDVLEWGDITFKINNLNKFMRKSK